jgi:hypothetical protein
MAKTEKNLKASEDFIRKVLTKNFKQKKFDAKVLRAAAAKLCDAVPAKEAA